MRRVPMIIAASVTTAITVLGVNALAPVGALADAPAQVEPRGAGQHHVEHDAIDDMSVERRDRVTGVGRRDDVEALHGQEVREQADDLRLILDEQHGAHAALSVP